MKQALFIGGTGTISSAVTRRVAQSGEWNLTLLKRGNRMADVPQGVQVLTADVRKDDVSELLKGKHYDVVVDFVAFDPEDVRRDFQLFAGRTSQYVFISSASAYQKPVPNYLITETTPLANPYWEYSRKKIACEELLSKLALEEGFPVTIVRPSHTYCERAVPVGVHGRNGSWQVVDRIRQEKPVIIHGDGSSLWTLTFNADFAEGLFGLMGNERAIGEAFHITSDESLTWLQVYQTIADALGVRLHPCFVPSSILAESQEYDLRGSLLGDKAASVVFDNSKIKRFVPSFHPVVRYAEGVSRALAYIDEHPELKLPDPEFDAWCDKVAALMDSDRRQMRLL